MGNGSPMNDSLQYWNTQFLEHGYIWGTTPSQSAEQALRLFLERQISTVLIPGCGYGRNSRLFSAAGFTVTGIEISGEACKLAAAYDPAMRLYYASFLEHDFGGSRYDAIYCFSVLHLFLADERQRFVAKCGQVLESQGAMYFTVISERDDYYGQGLEIEDQTFERSPGKRLHFFTEEDLRRQFEGFRMLQIGEIVDEVEHTQYGRKCYQFRSIYLESTAQLAPLDQGQKRTRP